jgi:hypothetical protein
MIIIPVYIIQKPLKIRTILNKDPATMKSLIANVSIAALLLGGALVVLIPA